MLWDSQAKAGLANSNQKEQGFNSLMEVSSKAQKAKAMKVRETVKHRAVWEVISGIYICTCLCPLSGSRTCMRGLVSV